MNRAAAIDCFAPRLVLHGLGGEGAPQRLPAAQEGEGFALFTDLSGFTRLSEQLVRQQGNSLGAEQLALTLNATMGRLVRTVVKHHGDVVAFAGDALLAIWPLGEGEDRAATLRKALAAAAAIRAVERDSRPEGIARLPVKIGLGNGSIRALHLGGTLGRRQLLVVGEAAHRAALAASVARPGAAVCAPELQDEARALADIDVNPEDGELIAAPTLRLPPPTTPVGFPPEASRAYLPAAVLHRAVEAADGWVAEIRRVSVLFVGMPELVASDDLDRMQALVREVQICLASFDGALNKLVVDEKGVSALAAFGLPPNAHETDPTRATLAAMAIHEALSRLGARCAIGVATGLAFCGAIGGEQRREYSMIGDAVNTAARLMSKAAGGILCDEATRAAAQGRVVFEELPAIELKGKSGEVRIARPLSERPATLGDPSAILGREAEVRALTTAIDQLVIDQRGAAIVVVGVPGMGKTLLARQLQALAGARGVAPTLIAGDPIARLSPFHAWAGWLREVLGPLQGPADLSAALTALLGVDHPTLSQAPLLAEVLGWPIADNTETRVLIGRFRAEATTSLLVAVAAAVAARRGPQLFLVEDAHWMDSLSLQVVLRLAREAHRGPWMVFVTARPPPDLAEDGWTRLRSLSGARTFALQPLDADQVTALAAARLGVAELPAPLAELLVRRSEGNPFFVEELLWHLWDSGVLAVEQGRCRLLRSLSAQPFPETLHGLIASRFDRLAPGEQLTMKIASVVGPEFSFQVVDAVHPASLRGRGVRRNLERLVQLDVVSRINGIEGERYRFNHVLVREAAYTLMPAARRAELHAEIGAWLEADAQRVEPVAPSVVAAHFEVAGDLDRALRWHLLAADQAERAEADLEALAPLRQAIALAPQAQPPLGPGPLADLHRRLAELHDRLGHPREAYDALRQALALLGIGPPIGLAAQLFALVRGLGRLGLRQLRGAAAPIDRGALQEAGLLRRVAERALDLAGPTFPSLLLALLGLERVAGHPGGEAEAAQLWALLADLLDRPGLRWLARRAAVAAADPEAPLPDLARNRVQARLAAAAWLHQDPDAANTLDRCVDRAAQLGDWSTWNRWAPVAAAMVQVEAPRLAPDHWVAVLHTAEVRGLPRTVALALAGLAYTRAEADLDRLVALLGALPSPADRRFARGALAQRVAIRTEEELAAILGEDPDDLGGAPILGGIGLWATVQALGQPGAPAVDPRPWQAALHGLRLPPKALPPTNPAAASSSEMISIGA